MSGKVILVLGTPRRASSFHPKLPWAAGFWAPGRWVIIPPRPTGAGAGEWGAGPTIVALRQEHGFTYGLLANHIWSFAGWDNQEVNATFIQPFLSYTTKSYTTIGVNTETTATGCGDNGRRQ